VISRINGLFEAVRRRRLRESLPLKFNNSDELCDLHFRAWSNPGHINRVGLTLAIRQRGNAPALIVETGTSAWGCDSSRLFASYTENFGGQFFTADIRKEPSAQLGDLGRSVSFIVDDSVSFLSNFKVPTNYQSISLAYLDSYDLDVNDPEPSMNHGLMEWHSLLPHLKKGSVIVVDDTPIDALLLDGSSSQLHKLVDGTIPGKGALILKDSFFKANFEILYHHYNFVAKWV
jgi:hypothetical protein